MLHGKRPQCLGTPLTRAVRLALFCVGGAAVSQLGYAAEGDEGMISLATVTVTGEKIERSLQETTTAVTVISATEADSGEAQSVYELIERVPNAIANPYGAPNIRGSDGTGPATGQFALMAGARPRVSTSVDGTSETWSGQEYVDAGLWDVEQVEVLRGPQSTTQGRNTIGGAVVVNTKDPTFAWEGAVRLGLQSSDGKGTMAGVISGPIIDNELAFRIAASGTKGHGYIDYPLSEGSWPWDPSESENRSIRAKLLWTPAALPELEAKLTVSRRDQKGEYLNFVNGDFSDYQLNGDYSNTRYQDSDSTTVSTDIQYQFSDSLTGHLLLSHNDYNATFEQFNSNYSKTVDLTMDLQEKSNTLEARLVYEPDNSSFSGMLGLYFYEREQDMDVSPGGFIGDDKIDTVALFGEGSYAITEQLKLIFGGRVEREEQKRNVLAWPDTPYEGLVKTDIGETMLLPKIGLSYTISPETTLGFTVRKGYNAGGGAVDWDTSEYYDYEKEEVITYEASLRSNLLNKRLTLGANAFYNQYDDYQALINNRFVNVPKGKSYGLELEANWLATSDLELFAALGLLDSEITEADARNPETEGNEFAYAPHLTARTGFKQSFSNGVFFGADANYVGEYYSSAVNDDSLKAGDYTLVNLNAGYEADDYTLRFYVRNALDEEVIYRQTNTRLTSEAQIGPPLTAGVVFDYRF